PQRTPRCWPGGTPPRNPPRGWPRGGPPPDPPPGRARGGPPPAPPPGPAPGGAPPPPPPRAAPGGRPPPPPPAPAPARPAPPDPPAVLARGDTAPPGAGAAALMHAAGSWRDVPLSRRSALSPGWRAAGPALIAEDWATTVVEPGWQAEVTSRGDLLLTRVAR